MADVTLTIHPQTAQVSHTWKTGILRAMNGLEARSALYTWPRIALRYAFMLFDDDEINSLKANLIHHTDGTWAVPIWPDATILTAQAASGQKVLAVQETAYRHFYAGRKVILISPTDFTSYEVKTINTIAAAQINVTVNLTSTWPAGTLVLPLYDCRMELEQKITAYTPLYQKCELLFTEEYETARSFAYSLPSSGADTYAGLDLFLQAPHRQMEYGYARPYDLLQEFGLGYAANRYVSGENQLGLKTAVIRTSRADLWDTITFFDSKQGRLQPFLIPTWSKDLIPTAAIDSEDTVIPIKDVAYETNYLPNDDIGRFVYIQFPDKSYVIRYIADADDGTPSITLGETIGTSVAAADLSKMIISYLIHCRFDQDELVIEYPVNRAVFGKADISIKGLVEDHVEVPS